MTATAIFLILLSAGAHAWWNFMGKRGNPSAAFFLVAAVAAALVCSPILLPYGHLLRGIPASVWLLIVLTGICQATYMTGLAWAYRLGHLSIAYPLARATPVVLVAVFNLALGRGHQIGTVALLGMAVVCAGCLLLPMRDFGDFRLSHYRHGSSVMALVAALGTCGYMLIDAEALRQLRLLPSGSAGNTVLSLLYLLLETVSTAVALTVYVLLVPAERRSLRELGQNGGLRQAAITGLVINLAYGLILASMAYVTNVSYIVAFRQLSIPLGATLGIMLLGEPRHTPKLAGVGIVVGGLLMVALG